MRAGAHVCVWMVAVAGDRAGTVGGSGQTVAAVVGPAAGDEEVGEAVELEVDVEEDHGQLGRLKLAQDKAWLGGDGLEGSGS